MAPMNLWSKTVGMSGMLISVIFTLLFGISVFSHGAEYNSVELMGGNGEDVVVLSKELLQAGCIEVRLDNICVDYTNDVVKGELHFTSDVPIGIIDVQLDAEIQELMIHRDYRGTASIRQRALERQVVLDDIKIKLTGEEKVLPFTMSLSQLPSWDGEHRDGKINFHPIISSKEPNISVKTFSASCQLPLGRPRVIVDPGKTYQKIDGFGTSSAWWAQYVGGSEAVREAIADLLWSKDKGIGLSHYRYNACAGVQKEIQDPWRTGETFEVAQGEYDWTRDANAQWFLQAAKERGVEEFILFAKSPQERITRNNKTWAEPRSNTNLAPNMYEQFAQYLVDIVKHFKQYEGIEFSWISPINEPDWNWDSPSQEGCPYTVDQIVKLSKVFVEVIAGEGLDVRLLVPEAGAVEPVYRDRNYALRLLGDPMLSQHLPVLAYHSYWSTDDQRAKLADKMRNYPEHRLWQTEWCEMVWHRDLGMDQALNLVRTVHADLTITNASAWTFWLGVSKEDYRDGLIYISPDYQEMYESKSLWSLGNFSRFIRPGAVRIDVTDNRSRLIGSQTPGIYVSAYLHEEDEYLIIVAVNELAGNAAVDVELCMSRERLSLIPYRTSKTETLKQLNSITLQQSGSGTVIGTLDLAPQSVTTYVFYGWKE